MLERVFQHERVVVPACLLIVTVLAWSYLLFGARTMQDMGGVSMPMSAWPWTAAHAVLMFAMWLVMMTAMMLPSAAPVILLYSAIARSGTAAGPAGPSLFALGYLAAWGCLSLVAVLAQFLLEWIAFLSPMMASTNIYFSGALLIAAGAYQFTSLKRSCLRSCRSPLEFLMSHWRSGAAGAFSMGARHGVYCVGCCWALMLLLFVGGVMNFMWIAALAVFVLIEKLTPAGQAIGRIAGAALIIIGVALLLGAAWKGV